MKICTDHWTKLRAALDLRGLSRFVSNDGKQVMERMVGQLEGLENPAASYDPLMAANFAIWSNGLQLGGLYLMSEDEHGEQYCPICEAVKHMQGCPAGDENWWIDNAANAQLEHARELGLLPKETVQ